MSQCTIRLACYEDKRNIMRFLDKYWQSGHILARDCDMFSWQYGFGEQFSIVIGVDEDDVIQGVLGFVVYSTDGKQKPDICLALWKANPGHAFLGMRLLYFLKKNVSHRHIFCVGINLSTTRKIYEDFGFKIGKMRQWYRLGPQREYKIALVRDFQIPDVTERQINILRISGVDETNLWPNKIASTLPYKSAVYVKNRYLSHPIYHYELYLAKGDNQKELLLIMRRQEVFGKCVLRLVDLIGSVDLLPLCTKAIDGILREIGAEYVDIYEVGVSEKHMLSAGFRLVESSGNIVPNYFYPYLQKNVPIYYATDDDNVRIFRGDGDQDRPN